MFIPQELENNTYFRFRRHDLLTSKIRVCKKIIDSGTLTIPGVVKSVKEYYELIIKYNILELIEIEFGSLNSKNIH
jgi:hypothetical protein